MCSFDCLRDSLYRDRNEDEEPRGIYTPRYPSTKPRPIIEKGEPLIQLTHLSYSYLLSYMRLGPEPSPNEPFGTDILSLNCDRSCLPSDAEISMLR